MIHVTYTTSSNVHTATHSTDVISSAIVFMDLRNDIVVINKRHQISNSSQTETTTITEGVVVVSNPPAIVSNVITYSMEVNAAAEILTKDGYASFVDLIDTNGWVPPVVTIFWNYPFSAPIQGDGTHLGTYTVPHFETSQPVGSWAVDWQGDTFVSFLHPTTVDGVTVPVVCNALTSVAGGSESVSPVDVAELRSTSPAEYEFAFYPVAPL